MTDLDTLFDPADPLGLAQVHGDRWWPEGPAGLPGGDAALQLLLHYALLEPKERADYPLMAMVQACPSHAGAAHPAGQPTHAQVRAVLELLVWDQGLADKNKDWEPAWPSATLRDRAREGLVGLSGLLKTSALTQRIAQQLVLPWDRMGALLKAAPERPSALVLAQEVSDFYGKAVCALVDPALTEVMLTVLREDPERRWALAMKGKPLLPLIARATQAQNRTLLQTIHTRLQNEVIQSLVAGRSVWDDPALVARLVARYPETASVIKAQERAAALAQRPAHGAPRNRHRP